MDVIIVGAGIAGLTCAKKLLVAGHHVTVLEASDAAGGRVRTDHVDGFLLDRGFQVLLTSYPEARAELDIDALELRSFEPGALIRYRGKFHRFVDPWRSRRHLISTALSPLATWSDKLRIAALRHRLRRKPLSDIIIQPDRSTLSELKRLGFSNGVIDRFFRPFIGGIFLESELATSLRMFEFVFAMFIEGYAALPTGGMQAIPDQMSKLLPADALRLNTQVQAVEADRVTLQSGERLVADAVVVATEAPAARMLLGDSFTPECNDVCCLYFAAERPPIEEPILVLNGDSEGPINNLSVPSQVVSSYAPPHKSLISVTVLDWQRDLVTPVLRQLHDWFGDQVDEWKFLKRYDIRYALPSMVPPLADPIVRPPRHVSGVFVCGDHYDTASLNGAMASGRRAADAVLVTFEGTPI